MRRPEPRATLYAAALIVAAAVGYGLMRIPIQVSDSLTEIVEAQQFPSAAALFIHHTQRVAYMRPLRHAQIKMIFDAGERLGHQLAYRGFHVLLVAAGMLLFVRALGVRTWSEAGAGAFAMMVLTGIHTFRGGIREAFPINHFLEIVVLCLLALNLAQSRPRWWIDAAAALVFVVASLTLESGLLIWVILVAAWLAGLRGVSPRGLAAVTLLVFGYMWVRFFYLEAGTPGLSERSSGFWFELLEPSELQQRFGDNPLVFYVYNVAAAFLSVLFSEPQDGVFQAVRAFLDGELLPRTVVAVLSSLATTAAIGWATLAAIGRWRGGDRDRTSALLLLFPAVLAANAALSYAYTKDEIITVAGAFYALAAYAAACELLRRIDGSGRGVIALMLCAVLAVSTLWTIRSLGVQHLLRVEAFKVRNDWARMSPERYADAGPPDERRAAALVRQLRTDALNAEVPNQYRHPRWADRWWGE